MSRPTKGRAKIYRDCYENEAALARSEEKMFHYVAAQLAIALDALRDIGNGTCGTADKAGPLARATLAKVYDPTKSIDDWAALYESMPIRHGLEKTK